jgi:hypothetical protein
MNPKLKKIIAKQGVITLVTLIILNIFFCQNIFCDGLSDSVENFKKDLPKMNKYQLQEKLNLAETLYNTDPSSVVYGGYMMLIKNHIQYHERLALQIRGLIQSGVIEGNVSSDGVVYVYCNLEGTDKEILMPLNELDVEHMEKMIQINLQRVKD